MVINRLLVRAVSFVLAVMFCIGTTTFAFAGGRSDNNSKIAESPVENANSFELLNSLNAEGTTQGEKQDFKLEATRVTDNSAVLVWSSKTVYISYSVCKYDVISKRWKEVIKTTSTALRLTDLSPDTGYKYCVMSTANKEVLGAVEFTTSSKTPTIELVSYSSCQAEIKVSGVDKHSYVEIYRSEEMGDFKKVGKVKSGDKTFVDKDLKSATSYTYKAKSVYRKGLRKLVSAYSNTVDVMTLFAHGLPAVKGTTKTYAYYTAVTATGSPQYRLLNSPECTTDPETGIRMYDGCYCVALGSYYGSTIGTKYRITLSSGNQFDVILCDQKADIHTDSNHQYAVVNNDILEFYVEGSKIPSGINGDYGRLEKFSGSVVAIEEYIEQDCLMYY